ncbi:MAG: PD-(D/E)XK nuclease family transposase, partial [Bacilli bacterium]|nr:PD-(D/E)XK nuclease family transposase [Bacilli bacterium]
MEEKKFYTCKNDRAFKEVFMKEQNKDLLISLLESILNIKIKELEYLNLEKNSDNINLRKKYFDLHVKTEKENIQIEVNPSVLDYTRPRNVSYIC